ncbi:MAG: hypothetical protein F4X54_07370 [Chloroflexi bacterium]|nr:hypothetical protein [Chloroflexota bacterium]MYB84537.1 hypothetical protein [Chloroflexota bacterium]
MRLSEAIAILEACAEEPPEALAVVERVTVRHLLGRMLVMQTLLQEQVRFEGSATLVFHDTDPEVMPSVGRAVERIELLRAHEAKEKA